MQTVAQVADAVQGEVRGDGARALSGVAPLADAGPRELSFFADARHRAALAATRAAAVLVDAGGLAAVRAQARENGPAFIVCASARQAVVTAARLLTPEAPPVPGVHPSAVVHPSAELGEGVVVGPLAVVEAGAHIGARSRIDAQTFVGAHSALGPGCRLWPGAKVMARCALGARVVLHPGAVVGGFGFGFAVGPGGRERMPQFGNVVLGDDCEVGANSCIDRASFGSTRAGRGVKIDNLVQVGHQVELGEDAVMCAQSGIAGSSALGEGSLVGAQAGIADHVRVAPGSRLSAQSGVVRSVAEPGRAWGGTPAQPHGGWLRAQVVARDLPTLRRRGEALERALGEAPPADDVPGTRR